MNFPNGGSVADGIPFPLSVNEWTERGAFPQFCKHWMFPITWCSHPKKTELFEKLQGGTLTLDRWTHRPGCSASCGAQICKLFFSCSALGCIYLENSKARFNYCVGRYRITVYCTISRWKGKSYEVKVEMLSDFEQPETRTWSLATY